MTARPSPLARLRAIKMWEPYYTEKLTDAA